MLIQGFYVDFVILWSFSVDSVQFQCMHFNHLVTGTPGSFGLFCFFYYLTLFVFCDFFFNVSSFFNIYFQK